MPRKISKEDEQKFIEYYLEGETAGNVNVEKGQNKTDAELIEELQGLVSKIPALKPKLAMIQDNTEKETTDTSDNSPETDDTRVTH